MHGHAPRPSVREPGSTAARCMISGSHCKSRHLRWSAQPVTSTVDVQHAASRNKHWSGIPRLVVLLLCLFSQYGEALAFVEGPGFQLSAQSSTSMPTFTRESVTSQTGCAASASGQSDQLRKRQGQTSGVASDPQAALQPALPLPFDGGVGNNFTNPNCMAFFQTFLGDHQLQACHAVSLLLLVRNIYAAMEEKEY